MTSLTSKRKPLSHLLLSLSSTSSRTLCDAIFSSSSSCSPPASSSSSTSSSSSSSSSSHSLPSFSHRPYSSLPRRYDEESRNVRVSVWWDIENCGVPTGSDVFKISQSIIAAVRANGIKGPVQISAFGDVLCLSRANQEALSVTGINLIHIPNSGRNSADRSLLVDLMHWVTQNPPPAHIFLISSDRDFAGILHRLRMNNYNILLAGKEGKHTPGVLCSAATIMWHWDELVRGENLSGRHFNQPPDGPFNSWYGHYKGPLEDPYDMPLLQNNSKANDSTHSEQSLDSQPHQGTKEVPKEVLKHIREIVYSHPNGLSITELRSQLNNRVTVDKNFYGFKKFSSLLQSLRRIVKVMDRADGQFLIRPVSRKAPEPVESDGSSTGFITEHGKWAVQVNPETDGETESITRMVNIEPILGVSHNDIAKESSAEEKAEETRKKVSEGLSRQLQAACAGNDRKVVDTHTVKSPIAATEEQNSNSDMGVLKGLWTKWFSSSTVVERMNVNIPDKVDTSSGGPEKSISGEWATKSSNEHEICDHAHSSSSTTLNVDAKSDRVSESEVSPGFVEKIISWFKSLRNESLINSQAEQLSEEQTRICESGKHEDVQQSKKQEDSLSSKKQEDALSSKKQEDAPLSKKHELFSKATFWIAFESFLRTYRASDIVLNSTSREQFAKRLQTDGPLVFRSLEESDLLDLIDLLISEKKWIKEFPIQIPRFRIVLPPGNRSPQPPNSNGMSSNEKPQSMLSSIMPEKPSEKTRSEILADCQNLLDELLRQHPEGFNIGIFKKKFLEEYEYSLEYQKLGYPKLVSLLQIMPGIRVDYSCVYPDNVVYAPGIASLGSKSGSAGSDSEMFDLSQKDEDVESQWEELGPVSNSNVIKQEEVSLSEINEEYKPSMADDDELSDPEEEESSSSSQARAEERTRKRVDEEDSSLLQILNSWHTTKDDSSPEGLVDCSREERRIEASSAVSSARKQRPLKSYTFVSNTVDSSIDRLTADKDKLIDGILGSLKKSGESRVKR